MHIPRATYRLQLTPDFTFESAAELVSYFVELGISDLYMSPMFSSKPGSNHGYDVVNMNEINPELGGRDGFEKLVLQMQQSGLAWLQDIVPNHRAFFGTNPVLVDVLENGPRSKFYRFFDITWEHPYGNVKGRVLAPFLGDFYARVLERGEIKLTFGPEGFRARYWELALPLKLESYAPILEYRLERLHAHTGFDQQTSARLLAVIKYIRQLRLERTNAPNFEHGRFLKDLLWELYSSFDLIREHIDGNLAAFNGGSEEPRNYDLLDGLLGEQYFRFAFWKVGTQELNYRRFFSINDLISLRVEEEDVFNYTHNLVFDLVREGKIQGLRVDHVDGLYDPTQYLQRLRAACPEASIFVEKILEPREELPPHWPVQGTTGYDFADIASGVLCDKSHEEEMERAYRSLTGMHVPYDTLVQETKRNIIGRHMAGDIDNLAILLKEITNKNRLGNDLTMYGVRRALVEVLTMFPIYRTYASDQEFTPRDREVLLQALQHGKETAPHFSNEIELIGNSLLTALEGEGQGSLRGEWINFLMRLQQYTGPLMAKGVEDTAFYIYARLMARNDVGCDPREMAYSVDHFHEHNAGRLAGWPDSMNSTSTHDTKRGEDTRARMCAISENALEWETNLARWQQHNRELKTQLNRRTAPSLNEESILYQTMLGAGPFEGLFADEFPRRIKEYMVKAVREAKIDSSWLNPNEPYEKALLEFIDRMLDAGKNGDFLGEFILYAKKIAFLGVINSLTQALLKLTVPGVPDIYQGAELWDLSLVDPDNRRAVDYARRREILADIRARGTSARQDLLAELQAKPESGAIKLFVLHETLKLRAEQPELFSRGEYLPVAARGARAEQVIAFARKNDGQEVLVVAPRLASRLYPKQELDPKTAAWEDTVITPPGGAGIYMNRFTRLAHRLAAEVKLSELLAEFPLALLVREPS